MLDMFSVPPASTTSRVAQPPRLRAADDRLQARRARLVDGVRRARSSGTPARCADLAREVRAVAGLAGVAEDRLVDRRGGDARRARSARARRRRAQVGGATTPASAPPNLPIGVRTAPATTTAAAVTVRALVAQRSRSIQTALVCR